MSSSELKSDRQYLGVMDTFHAGDVPISSMGVTAYAVTPHRSPLFFPTLVAGSHPAITWPRLSIVGTLRVVFLILVMELVGCTPMPRFTTRPETGSHPAADGGDISLLETGDATYYGDEFNGRSTSNGEKYDKNELTAAHRTLPFNTKVRVTNPANGKSVVVRINDRGPFKGNRIIDLSYAAAEEIGLIGPGTAKVQLEVIELGSGK